MSKLYHQFLLVIVLCAILNLTEIQVFGIRVDSSRNPIENTRLEDVLPGFKGRVTQKGLDYGAEVSVDALMKYLPSFVIPDIHNISVAGSLLSLTNMTIVEFPRPRLVVTLLPNTVSASSLLGGVLVKAVDLHPVVDMHIQYLTNWGLFVTKREGAVRCSGRALEISLQTLVGADNQGRPLLRDISCVATGDLDMTFQGDWKGMRGLFNMLKDTVKTLAFKEVCSSITTELKNFMNTTLATAPMTQAVDEDIVFDYRLLRAPLFEQLYLDADFKGAFYIPNNTDVRPTLTPSSINAPVLSYDKMIYVYLTEYVINSAWLSALTQRKLYMNVTLDMPEMPDAIRRYLGIICSAPQLCLGSIFPQLSVLYPDGSTEIDIHASRSNLQIVKFRGRRVSVRARGLAEFYMRTGRSRDFVFSVNITFFGNMEMSVQGSRLIFNISQIQLLANMKQSAVGDLRSSEAIFNSYLNVTTQLFLFPYIRALGLTGVEIPSVPELQIVNAHFYTDLIPGVLLFGTDLNINL